MHGCALERSKVDLKSYACFEISNLLNIAALAYPIWNMNSRKVCSCPLFHIEWLSDLYESSGLGDLSSARVFDAGMIPPGNSPASNLSVLLQ